VAIVLLPRALQWPLSNRVSRWVGDISFGVFLYHLLILHVVMNAMGLTPPAGQDDLDSQANWALIGELTLHRRPDEPGRRLAVDRPCGAALPAPVRPS